MSFAGRAGQGMGCDSIDNLLAWLGSALAEVYQQAQLRVGKYSLFQQDKEQIFLRLSSYQMSN